MDKAINSKSVSHSLTSISVVLTITNATSRLNYARGACGRELKWERYLREKQNAGPSGQRKNLCIVYRVK